MKKVNAAVKKLEDHFGRDAEIVITEQRFAYLRGLLRETVTRKEEKRTVTEKIDSVLLNRFLGLPIFLFILWGVFQLTFALGEIPKQWLASFFSLLGDAAASVIPEGILRSFVIDGLINGFGSVLSFIPIVIILFIFISLLEDSGYMARTAFIMDKFLHLFGLHGQSFLPMMIGFGCSVPAIMAARTLKNRKDRIVTILITPLISCGAKLPVYVLLAGVFFGSQAGNVVLSIYLVGILLALFSALVIRKKVMKGESTPFVMELPPYRLPTVKGIAWHVWDKTKHYFIKAGTMILVATMLIWAITSFPQPEENPEQDRVALEESVRQKIIRERFILETIMTDPAVLAAIPDTVARGKYSISVDRITQDRIPDRSRGCGNRAGGRAA